MPALKQSTVVMVPFCFHPDPVGGTQVYVKGLAKGLQQHGIKPIVAAPGPKTIDYEWEGLRVRRFKVSAELGNLSQLYDEGDEIAAEEFDRILAEERPSIVHLHAFTRGVSLRLVRCAKARGIPVVFTYHTPTVTCQQGTMMRFGTAPCDGVLDLRGCSRCSLHALFSHAQAAGVLPDPDRWQNGIWEAITHFAADVIGSVPPAFGFWLGRRQLRGRHWTALRTPELVQLRHLAIRALFNQADHLVAVCEWVKELLLRNGVPEEKVTLSRQGVTYEMPPTRAGSSRSAGSQIRIAFLGRLDSTKGAHVLIQAFHGVRDPRLQLDIYGVSDGDVGLRYAEQLRLQRAGDERIQFRPPLPDVEVIPTLRQYDLLAAPSQWLETGPLVVLEAFAAGIPVIGSNLGGIAELVRDGVDGILVEAADVSSWSRALRLLGDDPQILNSLQTQVRPPRTMSSVAAETSALYARLLHRRFSRACQPVACPIE